MLSKPTMNTPPRGFTLIELLVVMAIIATLLSLVAPRYFKSIDDARETVLRTNLKGMRDAIDKYRADAGRSPASLEELVEKRYLRELPLDPMTDRTDTWLQVAQDCASAAAATCTGIGDVRSGSTGTARDSTRYADW